MSGNEITQVLAQMRAMAAEAGRATGGTQSEQGADFGALLKQSIDSVSQTQRGASELANAFERGEDQVDLAEVMVALQKASVSFQAMTQVRNRLVEAYQDIKNMPI